MAGEKAGGEAAALGRGRGGGGRRGGAARDSGRELRGRLGLDGRARSRRGSREAPRLLTGSSGGAAGSAEAAGRSNACPARCVRETERGSGRGRASPLPFPAASERSFFKTNKRNRASGVSSRLDNVGEHLSPNSPARAQNRAARGWISLSVSR